MIIYEEIIKLNLRRKKYKYEIKYKDALSKSDSFYDISNGYILLSENLELCVYSSREEYKKCLKKIKKYKIKADHYKHLAEMYLEKKNDVNEKLHNLLSE